MRKLDTVQTRGEPSGRSRALGYRKNRAQMPNYGFNLKGHFLPIARYFSFRIILKFFDFLQYFLGDKC